MKKEIDNTYLNTTITIIKKEGNCKPENIDCLCCPLGTTPCVSYKPEDNLIRKQKAIEYIMEELI